MLEQDLSISGGENVRHDAFIAPRGELASHGIEEGGLTRKPLGQDVL
jgi:hypothetical protein